MTLQKILSKESTLKLLGPVDYPMLGKVLNHVGVQAAKKWHLVLHTNGGDANVAKSIHDILVGVNVTTVALSSVKSAGMIIFLGGKHRLATEDTIFMTHAIKSTSFIENTFKSGSLAITEKQLAKIFEEHNLEFPWARPLLGWWGDRRTYFRAKEAKELGVVHKIL